MSIPGVEASESELRERLAAILCATPPLMRVRVHLWFEAKFGEPYSPLSCTAEALERFASATFAVGVRLESDDQLYIEAPFGLADLFALRLVSNPYRKTVGFARASTDVRRRWPEVEIDDRSLAEPPQPPRTLAGGKHQKIDPESSSMPTVPVKFRQATSVDKEAIQRISADAYVPAYMPVLGTIPKPATEDYGERIEKGQVWILEVEGEPTGVAVLEERADHLLVYSIAVKPGAQRKGYGTALLDFADQRAIGLGLRELRLYTNERMERNLRLYRRHGFVELGKRPHPSRSGQVLIDMVRQLEPPTSEVEQG